VSPRRHRKVVPFENEKQRLLRQVSLSRCTDWRTTVPHAVLGDVGFARIGFAGIPTVGFTTITPDPAGIVGIARQHVMRTLDGAGLDTGAVDLTVHLAQGRRRIFTDANPASPSCGQRKYGHEARFHMEVRADRAGTFEVSLFDRGAIYGGATPHRRTGNTPTPVTTSHRRTGNTTGNTEWRVRGRQGGYAPSKDGKNGNFEGVGAEPEAGALPGCATPRPHRLADGTSYPKRPQSWPEPD